MEIKMIIMKTHHEEAMCFARIKNKTKQPLNCLYMYAFDIKHHSDIYY